METFYSILFPSLILFSLTGIILFLVKKAPNLNRIENEQLKNFSFADNPKKGWRKFFWPFGNKSQSDGSGGMLLFLEKILKKMKIVFLRLENKFSGWAEKIKNKRSERKENFEKQEKNFQEQEKISDNFSRFERTEKRQSREAGEIVDREDKKNIFLKNDFFECQMVEKIAANPKNISLYKKLGEYYWELKNFDYAKECFKQVMKINPRDKNVKQKMKEIEKFLTKKIEK
ncbi:MAG: hypothetical protein COZ85_03995 [Candidatus Moranbacteria bacterium CG_4_8_14_3_um_filter_34_16]|nr:MAG: hypothetical protein COT31_04345 [Candidatus Moranbacteria bacterium CG08_land_8_20_14_0_20_34_16]PIW94649.1 MAG: hypothetical protein COZ85_03995 [Candidatus Moranbacteria bacterium CG_4_8_14_3_um_filter_34_16]PJA89311.1 MAG: hypothetical protein CO138_01235 [Candidatus Moranbacteria bacterium CG_4_9_14_3_um_filter_33_15]